MKLQEKAPFTIVSAFAQPWTGGQPDSGSGINVQMTIQNLNKKDIQLLDFYFRGNQTKLEDISTNNNGLYIARYLKQAEKEVVLHKDSQKEAQNEPPTLQPTLPFQLKDNEGVISYIENGIIKYYKLENILEKFPNFYPSAPQHKQ
ncbi:hypothetical protein [Kordia periserrulae]|nr:hypothetical protein [Kordia periserrulae]